MPSTSAPITIKGSLEHIAFHNPENHFTVARLRTEAPERLISITGSMPQSTRGDTLEVTGYWEQHPRFGEQFRVISYEVVLPRSVAGIQRYLAAGAIEGVGPRTVARIVAHFGAETLEVIEQAPERLAQVRGIGAATAARIGEAWQRQHAVRRLLAFLHANGLSCAHAARLMQAYGEQAVEVLRHDPYRVVEDLPAVGFPIADTLARNQGLDAGDPRRVRACLGHLLNQDVAEGHVYTPRSHLEGRGADAFEIPIEGVREALEAMAAAAEIVIREDPEAPGEQRIYLRQLHQAETIIAARLEAMLAIPVRWPRLSAEDVEEAVLAGLALRLSGTQRQVARDLLGCRVAVVTGGPGTGKTTLVRSLTALFRKCGGLVVLAAPTGRAARRLTEVTGRPAATLHRLLEFNPQTDRFERHQDNPLEADVVIVDEASMVDTLLMGHFLKAVPPAATLILVGDVAQLPPVGPGNVLEDLIGSGRVPVYRLEEVFRQLRDSLILRNAHRVRNGQAPDLRPVASPEEIEDFSFIERSRPAEAAALIVELHTRVLPRRFHLDPIRDIQVLTPMHRGEVGTLQLNQMLQAALNPGVTGPARRFRPGDKVMHLRNNYVKEVFNGDIGVVTQLAPGGLVEVDFDGRVLAYAPEEQEELTLAYAISVHKSQGSEYPAVIVPLLTQHYALLQRNLLYTAMTRGQRLVVIIGTRRALDIALKNDRPLQRRSSLRERLAEAGRQP
jgi:exodeoxyribonuclease V alpha subunit